MWTCGSKRGTSECSHVICDLCFAAFDPRTFSLMRRADLKISDRFRCYPCIFAYAATTRCDGLGPAGRMNCTTIVPFACALQQNRAVDICETCRIMRRSTSGWFSRGEYLEHHLTAVHAPLGRAGHSAPITLKDQGSQSYRDGILRAHTLPAAASV